MLVYFFKNSLMKNFRLPKQFDQLVQIEPVIFKKETSKFNSIKH